MSDCEELEWENSRLRWEVSSLESKLDWSPSHYIYLRGPYVDLGGQVDPSKDLFFPGPGNLSPNDAWELLGQIRDTLYKREGGEGWTDFPASGTYPATVLKRIVSLLESHGLTPKVQKK